MKRYLERNGEERQDWIVPRYFETVCEVCWAKPCFIESGYWACPNGHTTNRSVIPEPTITIELVPLAARRRPWKAHAEELAEALRVVLYDEAFDAEVDATVALARYEDARTREA